MNEILKMLFEAAKHGNVEVHAMGSECGKGHVEEPNDNELKDIAKLNRKLYEAHIQEGFTSEEALALTVAVITS